MQFEGRETRPSSVPISTLGQPHLPEQSCTRHSGFTWAARGQAPSSLLSAADRLVQGCCAARLTALWPDSHTWLV